jgi:large subunit ribosomal protein L31e
MSQELERVYTINLGKVLLSPNNQRAKRAINMIKEFARKHMKNEQIKLEEDLSHQIWQRGIKHPPRKIRVKMTKTDEGFILVSPYEEEIEEAVRSCRPKRGKEKTNQRSKT